MKICDEKQGRAPVLGDLVAGAVFQPRDHTPVFMVTDMAGTPNFRKCVTLTGEAAGEITNMGRSLKIYAVYPDACICPNGGE